MVLRRRVLEVPEPGLSSHCGPGATQARGQRIEEDPGTAGEGQQAGQQAHAGQDPAPHMHTGDCVRGSSQ